MEKEVVSAFHADLNKALEILGAKYGFQLIKNSITYTSAGFTVSLGATEINSDGSVKVNPEKNMKMRMALSGLMQNVPTVVQGMTFNYNGKEYIILDWNNRARSYPFIYQDREGNQYKAGADFIAMRLNQDSSASRGALYIAS